MTGLEDNLGAIIIANKRHMSKNSEHMEIHNHFVHENVCNKVVNVIKID